MYEGLQYSFKSLVPSKHIGSRIKKFEFRENWKTSTLNPAGGLSLQTWLCEKLLCPPLRFKRMYDITKQYPINYMSYFNIQLVVTYGSFKNHVYSNGGEGFHQMLPLLNRFGESYFKKLSTSGEGGQKCQKSVNVVCERAPS